MVRASSEVPRLVRAYPLPLPAVVNGEPANKRAFSVGPNKCCNFYETGTTDSCCNNRNLVCRYGYDNCDKSGIQYDTISVLPRPPNRPPPPRPLPRTSSFSTRARSVLNGCAGVSREVEVEADEACEGAAGQGRAKSAPPTPPRHRVAR